MCKGDFEETAVGTPEMAARTPLRTPKASRDAYVAPDRFGPLRSLENAIDSGSRPYMTIYRVSATLI